MHLGSSNPKHAYSMGGRNLMETATEKDLGVLFDSELDFDKHIRGIVNKANRIKSNQIKESNQRIYLQCSYYIIT